MLAGARLHSYVAFRADCEGMDYDLSEAFSAQLFRRGYRFFFGIHVSESGDLLRGEQNPESFAAFQREAAGTH